MIGRIMALLAIFEVDARVPATPTDVDRKAFGLAVQTMLSETNGQGIPSVCEAVLHGEVNYTDLFSVRGQDAWEFCEKTRDRKRGPWEAECTMPGTEGLWACKVVSQDCPHLTSTGKN